MRKLLLVPALAVAVTAAVTASSAGAGDQRTSLGGGVSAVLPAGWHLTHSPHMHIARSAITRGDCGPSDNRLFREGGRGYQVQIYLGPDAPALARTQIAAILDSWRVRSGQ